MQCNIPPRVYSYYQESFKGINTAGNDKKEALIQAQIHQDQQVTLTAQQIAQIKLQAAKDYNDFWAGKNDIDWKKATAEDIRKWREKDAELEKQWREEEAKKLQNLPLEEAKLRATMLNNQRIEDNNRVINACQAIVNDSTTSPDKKQEARRTQEAKRKEIESIQKQTEELNKATSSQSVAQIYKQSAVTILQAINQQKNIGRAATFLQQFGRQQQAQEENAAASSQVASRPQEAQKFTNNKVIKEELIKNQQIQDKETLEKTNQQLKEQEWTQEEIDKFKKIHNNQVKEEYDKIKNLSSKETKVLALKSIKESVEILKEQAENTGLSEKERMEAKANAQYLDEQIKEVVQNKKVDQKSVQQTGIDVSKYQTPDNQEKMSESNEQSATTQEADKATDNTQESPAAPKVPNENKIASDNTASQPADTHSNTEESGKSTESVSGLTTLKLSATKLNETIDESNYQFRTTGLELA